MCHFGLI
jgi:hypothetical protein